MQKYYKLFSVIVLICFTTGITCAAEDNEVEWGYKGSQGPEHWGKIDDSFALCATGKIQSPINIPSTVKKSPFALSINYQQAPLVIVEEGDTELMTDEGRKIVLSGHDVQINFPKKLSKETITFNGKEFRLLQFHMHTPSENKLRGKSYPMEVHFVHQGEGGKVVVIGVFVQNGQTNPTFQKIIDNLPKEGHQEVIVKDVSINPIDLLPAKKDYFNFAGSLTTPPCAEGVQWIQMSEPISASPKQIAAIKKASEGSNARPVQPLNQREVFFAKAQ